MFYVISNKRKYKDQHIRRNDSVVAYDDNGDKKRITEIRAERKILFDSEDFNGLKQAEEMLYYIDESAARIKDPWQRLTPVKVNPKRIYEGEPFFKYQVPFYRTGVGEGGEGTTHNIVKTFFERLLNDAIRTHKQIAFSELTNINDRYADDWYPYVLPKSTNAITEYHLLESQKSIDVAMLNGDDVVLAVEIIDTHDIDTEKLELINHLDVDIMKVYIYNKEKYNENKIQEIIDAYDSGKSSIVDTLNKFIFDIVVFNPAIVDKYKQIDETNKDKKERNKSNIDKKDKRESIEYKKDEAKVKKEQEAFVAKMKEQAAMARETYENWTPEMREAGLYLRRERRLLEMAAKKNIITQTDVEYYDRLLIDFIPSVVDADTHRSFVLSERAKINTKIDSSQF